MKLRIRGNSIRLRLVKTEVERLADGQQVLETTRLGPGPEDTLTYSLGIHSDNAPVQVCWAPGNLGVTVAGELAKELADRHSQSAVKAPETAQTQPKTTTQEEVIHG